MFRGCALLYVPFRNQHTVRSFPIGYMWTRAEAAADGDTPTSWSDEWTVAATQDFSNWLAVPVSLDFRANECGGEDRIQEYTHNLAVKGGQMVARILGTDVLENAEGSRASGSSIAQR